MRVCFRGKAIPREDGPQYCGHRRLADQYSYIICNDDSIFRPDLAFNNYNVNTEAPGHAMNCVGEDIKTSYWDHHTTCFNDIGKDQFTSIGGPFNTDMDYACALTE